MKHSPLLSASQTRTIATLPNQVGPIAYGFWRFAGTSVKEAREKVELALELGMNFFDHADIYGCDGGGQFGDAEALFGEVLKEAPHLREQCLLATKGGIVLGRPYDSSFDYLSQAVERSLNRLNVDLIDLYQIHRPDFLTHPAALADTLEKLKESGKVKAFGVSNYTVAQTRALQAHLSFPLVSTQPEWSCFQTQALRDGTLDLSMELGLTPLGWSPLAGGKLAWNDQRIAQEVKEGNLQQVQAQCLRNTCQVLDRIAQEQNLSRAAVAIAWAMAHPAQVIPIIGTQNLSRMRDCAQALKCKLSRELWNEVLVASQGYPLP